MEHVTGNYDDVGIEFFSFGYQIFDICTYIEIPQVCAGFGRRGREVTQMPVRRVKNF